MRGHKRIFIQDEFQHIYHRSIDQVLIFYTMEDRLVYYTLFSVLAKRYGIIVLAMALMFDHAHALLKAPDLDSLSRFIGTTLSRYTMAFNSDSGRKGPLFEKAFGNAVKRGDKKVRTCIAYIGNNSVEKELYVRAEDDPWNCLGYLRTDHPFSKPIVKGEASPKLMQSLEVVKRYHKRNCYLEYPVIRRLFHGLAEDERAQLFDFIMSTFLPIDRAALLQFYKSYDEMIYAINSNTGSEYDIKERNDPDSHRNYVRMLEITKRSSFSGDPRSIILAPDSKKWEIFEKLQALTGARAYQIKRFLHLSQKPKT
ncbi:MAG: transposase [Bacteroidales bacterium]|nr:transposase [Bacteroidales bacterium]